MSSRDTDPYITFKAADRIVGRKGCAQSLIRLKVAKWRKRGDEIVIRRADVIAHAQRVAANKDRLRELQSQEAV